MGAFQIVASQSRRDYLSVEKVISTIPACRRYATIKDAFLTECRCGVDHIFSTERYIPNGMCEAEKRQFEMHQKKIGFFANFKKNATFMP